MASRERALAELAGVRGAGPGPARPAPGRALAGGRLRGGPRAALGRLRPRRRQRGPVPVAGADGQRRLRHGHGAAADAGGRRGAHLAGRPPHVPAQQPDLRALLALAREPGGLLRGRHEHRPEPLLDGRGPRRTTPQAPCARACSTSAASCASGPTSGRPGARLRRRTPDVRRTRHRLLRGGGAPAQAAHGDGAGLQPVPGRQPRGEPGRVPVADRRDHRRVGLPAPGRARPRDARGHRRPGPAAQERPSGRGAARADDAPDAGAGEPLPSGRPGADGRGPRQPRGRGGGLRRALRPGRRPAPRAVRGPRLLHDVQLRAPRPARRCARSCPPRSTSR